MLTRLTVISDLREVGRELKPNDFSVGVGENPGIIAAICVDKVLCVIEAIRVGENLGKIVLVDNDAVGDSVTKVVEWIVDAVLAMVDCLEGFNTVVGTSLVEECGDAEVVPVEVFNAVL